jgi:hypothetical protein
MQLCQALLSCVASSLILRKSSLPVPVLLVADLFARI